MLKRKFFDAECAKFSLQYFYWYCRRFLILNIETKTGNIKFSFYYSTIGILTQKINFFVNIRTPNFFSKSPTGNNSSLRKIPINYFGKLEIPNPWVRHLQENKQYWRERAVKGNFRSKNDFIFLILEEAERNKQLNNHVNANSNS